MAEKFTMENEYTLGVRRELPSGGTLTREFNFAAETITTLYERVVREKESIGNSYSTSAAASTSVAVAAQLTEKKFSELDSLAEVEIMREKLRSLGGNPPQSDTKQKIAPAKLSQ